MIKLIKATFICDDCKQINQVEGLWTSDTGKWFVECECGSREEIGLSDFDTSDISPFSPI